jgi:hypothetical protein
MRRKKTVDFINFKLGFITTTENESSIRGAQLVSIRIPTIKNSFEVLDKVRFLDFRDTWLFYLVFHY